MQGYQISSSCSSPTPSTMEEKTAVEDKSTKVKLPRLYHKKSRTGCQRCRARRVKCDETRPVCGSCNRHEVPCVYVNPAPLAKPASQKSQSTTSTGTSTPELKHKPDIFEQFGPVITFPLLTFDQDEALQQALYMSGSPAEQDNSNDAAAFNIPECKSRRMLELRLLQNFIENTSHSFSACNSADVVRAWSVDVPKLSLNHDNLLYEMFAISALHLLKSEPNNADLIVARQAYLGLSLREHRRAVALLHSESADAVCFTSSLILIDSFASIQDRIIEPYLPPMEWLQMARGAGSLFSIALNALNNFEASSIQAIARAQPNLSNEGPIFSPHNREGYLQDLLNHERQSEPWDLETQQAYERTLSYIGHIQIALMSDEHILATARRLMAFALMVPRKFVDMVEECRPRALVVLSHFFALAARMSHIWWIGNMAQREVEAIAKVLPLQWQVVMAMPLAAVGSSNLPISISMLDL